MLEHSESTLARVSQQLSCLEKRDWELWVIVSLAGILVSVGLLIVFFPTTLKGDIVHFEVALSRPLVIGLFGLLALLNTYLVTKRFEVRRYASNSFQALCRTEWPKCNRSPTR